MILCVLFPVLILGNVESQTATSEVVGNQTIREYTANSTMKPGNVTSSLYEDEESLIEDELQNSNQTSIITEDDEDFQEQENEISSRYCQEDMLDMFSHSFCGAAFHTEMMSISTESWCVLENIIRPYNEMTLCLERLSFLSGCYYPNPNIQDFFLYIHSYYFHNCTTEKLPLVDAPHGLVIALTLIPVSFIPVLVYLVVRKSSVQE